MDYVYENWQAKEIVQKGQSLDGFKTIDVSNGNKRKVEAVAASDTRAVMPKDMKVSELQINYLGDSIPAPIKKDQKLATLIVKEDDKLGYLAKNDGQTIDLVAKNDVKKKGFFAKLFSLGGWLIFDLVVILAVFVLANIIRKNLKVSN